LGLHEARRAGRHEPGRLRAVLPDVTGEYRPPSTPTLEPVFQLDSSPRQSDAGTRDFSSRFRPARTRSGHARLGKMQEVPRPSDPPDSGGNGERPFLPLARRDQPVSADASGILAVVTVAIPGAAGRAAGDPARCAVKRNEVRRGSSGRVRPRRGRWGRPRGARVACDSTPDPGGEPYSPSIPHRGQPMFRVLSIPAGDPVFTVGHRARGPWEALPYAAQASYDAPTRRRIKSRPRQRPGSQGARREGVLRALRRVRP